jgi:hypothetical protein
MDPRVLERIIDDLVKFFPEGWPGRPSLERRYVRVYFCRAVLEMSPRDIRRRYGLTRAEYQHAYRSGEVLVREESDGGLLDWSRVCRLILSRTREPEW